tara:strand:- start:159 stop:335 length:177 start_codon:yes stop_codon:yes gene_type:complete
MTRHGVRTARRYERALLAATALTRANKCAHEAWLLDEDRARGNVPVLAACSAALLGLH